MAKKAATPREGHQSSEIGQAMKDPTSSSAVRHVRAVPMLAVLVREWCSYVLVRGYQRIGPHIIFWPRPKPR